MRSSESPESGAPPSPAGATGRPRDPSRSEVWLALLAALVFFALPVAPALFSREHVLFGVDTATVQLPWSAVLPAVTEEGAPRPRNPGLSDQGIGFYPLYRWVAESWVGGDPPLWNPLEFVGAPGVGNPQSGVLDPQVWVLVCLRWLGGVELFDWGFALLGWLRCAGAGLGAYLLARRLGAGLPGGVLAGATFGLSGYQVLWLGHSLGHVPPFLPWVLLGLEGLRGERWRGSFSMAALALSGAILGGHPETAFFVGATAGLWALALARDDLRAGLRGLLALALGSLAASAYLLPVVEYLQHSAAREVRGAMVQRTALDLAALGCVVFGLGCVLVWRRAAVGESENLALARGPLWLKRLAFSLGLALPIGLVFATLGSSELGRTAGLALVYDAFGAPGRGEGYHGPGTSILEEASAWVAPVALALAIASILGREGPLRRRNLIASVGMATLLLSVRMPGVVDLWRLVPGLGLGDTVRFASVSSLMLALLAAEGLEAPRLARLAAATTVAVLVVAFLVDLSPGPAPSSEPTAPEADELVGFLVLPPPEADNETVPFEGWLHPSVPFDGARVLVEALDPAGEAIPSSALRIPLELRDRPGSGPAQRALQQLPEPLPAGTRFFSSVYLQVGRLDEGLWRFSLELFDAERPSEGRSRRRAAVVRVHRSARVEPWTVGGIALGLVLVAAIPPGSLWTWALVLLGALQVLGFARGMNPAVPRAESFPPTRTEALLERELGARRFFSEPGVLPPNTALVSGFRALDGYDAMDLASFNAIRPYALRPGIQGLLGWNARGVDLDAPFFRLMGVGVLALSAPIDHPRWELFAAPPAAGLGVEAAEVFLYRSREPYPRAFCVPEVVTPDELAARLGRGRWDPMRTACIAEDWRPRRPFAQAAVEPRAWSNNRVELEVALDGDGLLVLSEQHYPGWRVFVDGEERPLFGTNGIFRGVALEAGEHEVVFAYRPGSLRWGMLLSALGIAGLLGVGLVRPGRERAPA